jgi:hypothetical protein
MARPTRRVVSKVDSLSVLRFSLLLYLSFYLVVVVAAVVLWAVATVVGAVDNIERFIKGLFALESFHFDALAMLRGMTVGGLLLVMLGTGVNVLVAVLYNLISDVVGGVSVVVSEQDLDPAPRKRRVRSPR